MSVTNGNLGAEAANTFFMHALEALLEGRLEVKRPNLLYPDTFPLESWDSNVASGMEYASKFVDDWAGQAKVRARDSIDISTMGMTTDKVTTQVFEYAIANNLDMRTINQGRILAQGGFSQDPTIRMPQIANAAIKEAYEKLLLFGDTIQDTGGSQFAGFINNPVVTIGSATGVWSGLDEDQIIFDIQAALISVIENSNTVHSVTDVLMPQAQYNIIATTKAGSRANDETILNFVRTQGLAPERNGGTINIRPYRHLKGAGVGQVDRMIAYEKLPENFIIVNPVDFNVVNVIPKLFGFEYGYNAEISPLLLTYPRCMSYVDGI